MSNKKNAFMIAILKNGKYPDELYKNKFLEKVYLEYFKYIAQSHRCHLCQEIKDKIYNTAVYKFYTNDKKIYKNINEEEKSGIVICHNCLNNIIVGRRYIEKNLTAFYLENNIMIIPHMFNEEIEDIYSCNDLASNNKESLLSKISIREKQVLEKIGKINSKTDIIFFEVNKSQFKINYTIRSLSTSRFGEIGEYLGKHEVFLESIISNISALNISSKGVKSTKKERANAFESVFIGRKIDRRIFFNRIMMVYKNLYLLN